MTAGYVGADDPVSLTARHPVRPAAKAGAVPFEAVIGMAETVRRNAEQGVVFCVRRRDHESIWSQAAENRILEGSEPLGIEMLDRLDQHCAVESLKPGGSVEKRRMQQLHMFAGNSFCFEPGVQARQREVANIHAHDAVEVLFRGDAYEKVAVAATEVQNRSCLSIPDNVPDSVQAEFMQPPSQAETPGFRMMATSLRGISQAQPNRSATARSVSSL